MHMNLQLLNPKTSTIEVKKKENFIMTEEYDMRCAIFGEASCMWRSKYIKQVHKKNNKKQSHKK